MKFTNALSCKFTVILSNAKDLGRESSLCYAPFRMTGQKQEILILNNDLG